MASIILLFAKRLIDRHCVTIAMSPPLNYTEGEAFFSIKEGKEEHKSYSFHNEIGLIFPIGKAFWIILNVMFVPLHIYSGFSFLKSGLVASKIPLLAKKLGYDAVGISDVSTLSGYAPFFHACEKSGIKPLFLMDAEILEGTLSVFVLSEEGYRNLLLIELEASRERLTLEFIKQKQDGLAFILNPETTFLHRDYKEQDDNKIASRLATMFKGLRSLYFGIPYLPNEPEFIAFLRSFTEKYPYETIAFPFIAYEKENDAIVTSITRAIDAHEVIEEKERSGTAYFLSPNIISNYYTPAEIKMTETLKSHSSFFLIKKRGTLIHFENEEGLSSEEYLQKKALEGLKKKIAFPNQTYIARLDYELKIICEMGYADYFLVVSDYVHFAKTHNILVGPGRGSGPASLVSFALDISTINPIKSGLLFERFLNPERKSMPDIDVDFEDTKRDMVIAYLQTKYGKNRVSRVLATQTIGAKEALRDIGRVYDYEEREISLIASTIHNDRLSLRQDYRFSPEFKKLIDSDPYYLQIVSLAAKIEGLPRQAGLHAAGVILNNEPLENVIPIKEEEGVGYVGCLEKDYLEEQGFLKMDLLGLTNLSLIDLMLELIRKNEGIDLHFESIPFDDKESISLIKEGKTMGIFQMESAGMRRAIKEIEPTTFEDIAALEALFRPGPMESIPVYARRKKGYEKVHYLDPALEPILSSTYGIIVYQEQIMQLTQAVASFSLGEADLFRRAISKKDAEKLHALKGKFIDGCIKNGRDEKLANDLFSLIERFANYGFNKAHAVSYGVLTCRMAYLKKHYPMEFYCAVLDAMSVGDAKFLNTIAELKELGIRLKCPDVNRSSRGYEIENGHLLLPLSAIKNMQNNFLSGLLDERIENGPFKNLADFVIRTKRFGLTLPLFIRLVDAGAFDCFKINRASLRASGYRFLKYAEMMGSNENERLFDLGIEEPEIDVQTADPREDLDAEYDALGMMVSGSPLDFYQNVLKQRGAIPLLSLASHGTRFLTAGIIGSIRVITTKKGNQMCFLDVYDDVAKASFTLFQDAYQLSFKSLKEGNIVLIQGRVDQRKNGYLADKVETLGESNG